MPENTVCPRRSSTSAQPSEPAVADPVTLLACHSAGEFGYADGGVVTGRHTAAQPFPLDLDLDTLL